MLSHHPIHDLEASYIGLSYEFKVVTHKANI